MSYEIDRIKAARWILAYAIVTHSVTWFIEWQISWFPDWHSAARVLWLAGLYLPFGAAFLRRIRP